MNEASALATDWVCPFCALACDHLQVQIGHDDEPLAPRWRGIRVSKARQVQHERCSRGADTQVSQEFAT